MSDSKIERPKQEPNIRRRGPRPIKTRHEWSEKVLKDNEFDWSEPMVRIVKIVPIFS